MILVQSDYIVDNVDPTRFVSLIADARDDVVLDITSILRGPATPFTPTIPLIHAGRNIDIVLGDSLQGNDLPTFTSTFLQVDVYQPPQFAVTVPPTGQYRVFFHPDPAGPYVYNDPVIVAFGTVEHLRTRARTCSRTSARATTSTCATPRPVRCSTSTPTRTSTPP